MNTEASRSTTFSEESIVGRPAQERPSRSNLAAATARSFTHAPETGPLDMPSEPFAAPLVHVLPVLLLERISYSEKHQQVQQHPDAKTLPLHLGGLPDIGEEAHEIGHGELVLVPR